MKRILIIVCALVATVALQAQVINNVDVKAVVGPDGSATITQVWDAEVSSGTEFYIPMENLGPMEVSNLQVSENGQRYISEGTRWKVSRSLAEKAGRCGIVEKSDGVELCWGQGSMGRHIWTATFDVTNLVQGYDDYDGFNFMFVNPGIGPIGEASVTIENGTGGEEWTSDNVKVWGFGFDGHISVVDGKIKCVTYDNMSKSNKIIVLARFDKGLVQPEVDNGKSFEKLQQKALKGSDYTEDESLDFGALLFVLVPILLGFGALLFVIIATATGRTKAKKIYGVRKVDGWWRQPPEEGNLFASYYILEKGERFATAQWPHGKDLVGACFLKWVLEKKVIPVKEDAAGKRYNLQLEPGALFDDAAEGDLYQMVVEAAGSNMILETGEFERWSKRKYERIMNWPGKAAEAGRKYLIDKNRLDYSGYSTDEGKEEACKVIQFKNFLKDFTLNDERGVPEVALWKDYLVYAQLYGIADEVTKQLKKLYPADFAHYAQTLNIDPAYLPRIITMNRSLANNAYANAAAKLSSVRSGGGGGFTSIGGGGGFSGGGFGGGSR